MGPELRTGLTSAHLVQLAFPALRDLPLLAPLPESSSTQLIVAPEVALTKLPATNGALAARTEPAPVLSPSQVRCFFECPARWWFKYGLQLPERKNSSLALGLAVHQALDVNFREKLETQEDLETTGVLMVFRGSLDGTGSPDRVHLPARVKETCAGWVKDWLPSTWTKWRQQWNPPQSNSMCRVGSAVSRSGTGSTCWTWKGG